MEGYFPDTCPGERFDAAIVMGVMDYIEDAPAFLTALRSVVTEAAVISFPSIHWFRTPFRKLRYRLRRCPVRFYSQGEIERMAQSLNVRKYRLKKIEGAGMDYVLWLSI